MEMDNQKYVEELNEKEKKLFEEFYAEWKEKEERFHTLKQNEAINNFKERIGTNYFVNPSSRIELFEKLKEDQNLVYEKRMSKVIIFIYYSESLININFVVELFT